MNIKKIITSAASVLLAVSLTACSGDSKSYSGGWENGKPQGEGIAYKEIVRPGSNSIYYAETGEYVDGTLVHGGTLVVYNGSAYSFCYGNFSGKDKDDKAVLDGEDGYSEEIYLVGFFMLGTFRGGLLAEGTRLYTQYDKFYLRIGSYNDGKNLTDGYEIIGPDKGNVIIAPDDGEEWEYYEYTNGESRRLSAEEAATVSELKDIDADYILQLALSHSGHKDVLLELADKVAEMSGIDITDTIRYWSEWETA